MAPKPLLSSTRASSEHSDEQAGAEEALLTGQTVDRNSTKARLKTFWARWKDSLILLYAALMTGGTFPYLIFRGTWLTLRSGTGFGNHVR